MEKADVLAKYRPALKQNDEPKFCHILAQPAHSKAQCVQATPVCCTSRESMIGTDTWYIVESLTLSSACHFASCTLLCLFHICLPCAVCHTTVLLVLCRVDSGVSDCLAIRAKRQLHRLPLWRKERLLRLKNVNTTVPHPPLCLFAPSCLSFLCFLMFLAPPRLAWSTILFWLPSGLNSFH